MGERVTCFWVEPTESVKLWLRRFRFSNEGKCAGPYSYCNAMVDFGEHPVRWKADADDQARGCKYLANYDDLAPPQDDPRWPTKCEHCGYEFQPIVMGPCNCGKEGCTKRVGGDEFQVFQKLIYVRRDTGERFAQDALPAGAMWDAFWMHGWKQGPDGISLMVMCPGGSEWLVDGSANNGPGWTRTGTIPHVTARPSILTPNYHGFLTDGVLESC